MGEKLVDIRNLKTTFYTTDGVVPAVDGVSLHIDRGETLGVVGESGCGKSVTALSVMRLIPWPPGKIEAGEIQFEGQDLLKKSEAQMRAIRGNDISMIFQEPMTSLNPVYTVGNQISEAIELHQGLDRRAALKRTVEMLKLVGIPLPERRVHEYPHQLSGGMRQRVMIAMALSCSPKLLIADEPTTALDVTIQAQILELMKRLKKELGMAIMLITHDLGVVAEMAQRVTVMYAGKVVEEAQVVPLFRRPLHPYTRGLLDSIPHMDAEKHRLHVIEGVVPNPMYMPKGCRFNPRCPYAQDKCREHEPELGELQPGRKVSCWFPLTGEQEGVAS
ncbi:MAG: ABC transporter ATP-binding protein [Bacillota bacterium]